MLRARSSRSGVVVVSVMRSPPCDVSTSRAAECANYPSGLAACWISTLDRAQRSHVPRPRGLVAGDVRHGVLERLDAAGQALDRVGHRVWQVDPVGVGALDLLAFDAHDVARVADDG